MYKKRKYILHIQTQYDQKCTCSLNEIYSLRAFKIYVFVVFRKKNGTSKIGCWDLLQEINSFTKGDAHTLYIRTAFPPLVFVVDDFYFLSQFTLMLFRVPVQYKCVFAVFDRPSATLYTYCAQCAKHVSCTLIPVTCRTWCMKCVQRTTFGSWRFLFYYKTRTSQRSSSKEPELCMSAAMENAYAFPKTNLVEYE